MNKDLVTVNFRVAAKAFIINKGKLFTIKRAEDDVQSPGIWEIPGGRLDFGEDPILGLMREIREETERYVNVIYPISVRHFTRKDGQVITMLIFLCKAKKGHINLSEEHSEYKWMELNDYKKFLNPFFHEEVETFFRLGLHMLT